MEIAFLVFVWAIFEQVLASGINRYPFLDIGEAFPSDNLLIFTKDGPIPEYLLKSPYKIFPIPKGGVSRRSDDAPVDASMNSNSRVKNSTEKKFATRLPSVKRPWIRQRNKKLRENANRSRTIGTYAQRYQSAGGRVTTPSKVSQGRPTFKSAPNRQTTKAGEITTKPIKVQQKGLPFTRPPKQQDFAVKEPISDMAQNQLSSFISNSKTTSDNSKKKSSGNLLLNYNPKPNMEVYANPDPYSFGYGVDDGLGTAQYRQETATGDGVVKGIYGYKDFQGIYRHVEYTADQNGFHAVVKSNEPGVGNSDTADVVVVAEPPLQWTLPRKVIINNN